MLIRMSYYLSALARLKKDQKNKRAMGLEPTTFSLATRRSTTELRPRNDGTLYIVHCTL